MSLRIFIFFCLVLLTPKTLMAEEPITMTLYTEINHPYVYYKNNSKELTGIAYDMVLELAKRANIQPQIIVAPWLRAIRMLENNNDSCLFIMNKTKEREKKYQWIGPMIIGGIAIFKKPDSPIVINSMDDLQNYTVIGKVDSVSIQSLKEKYNIKLLEASTDEQAVTLLYHGRAPLLAAGIIDAPLAAKYLDYPKPVMAFKRGTVELSIGCSLNLPALKMNKLLDAYHSMNSFRQKILDKY